MKNTLARIIEFDLHELEELCKGDYFYELGEFDIKSFRKYQWHLYGKLELALELDIITLDQWTATKRYVRLKCKKLIEIYRNRA